MHLIDEDHITQAVIACHAGAQDARLRDVMTSLVQHLHAFAREVQLTEAEWHAGLRFLREAGRAAGPDGEPGQELALLSDVLGLTTLVTAINQRRPAGPGARPAVPAAFTPPPSAATTGPVAGLLRALGRRP
jgi:hydroxyquinol 1,2-dioxygenase